ncbi:uncharacterized protein SCHCODRAFT_02665354 [Schizophyllum commune H4-8]|uniref:uncharacterized protein n=1 Tax=Schizophyllum commune (strain H4-8 / FGSC 9210) TaxID=578458 RepID=UPI00215EF47F|nr:uncharacterized protein SCHCODRAFT_02665354 [Schizophyllum commune H4-8]KAI5894944.1 hypothetical protein SCHCODRAFT_02665354 [Schizophyllum commune H4-8]
MSSTSAAVRYNIPVLTDSAQAILENRSYACPTPKIHSNELSDSLRLRPPNGQPSIQRGRSVALNVIKPRTKSSRTVTLHVTLHHGRTQLCLLRLLAWLAVAAGPVACRESTFDLRPSRPPPTSGDPDLAQSDEEAALLCPEGKTSGSRLTPTAR